ncbi:MAG: PA2779 family protein [Bdellovibrionota bacterium]
MRFPKALVTTLVFVLSFAMVEVTCTQSAQAAMIATSQAVADLGRAQNLETVHEFLHREQVQRELTKRGVSPGEAETRIASLSNFELQKMAGDIRTAPAGADVIVISLGTLLLIIIIILLLRR